MESQAFNQDIMKWEQFPNYDVLYTDPPWGNRMIKWFSAKQTKDTGKPIEYPTLETILNHLGKLANPNKPLIIEYSLDADYLVETMQKYGHRFTKKMVRLSKKKKEFAVLVFNCDYDLAEGIVGLEIVTQTILALNAKVVFDPFAGRGWFAKSVHKAGATYIGSEISPYSYALLKEIVETKASW